MTMNIPSLLRRIEVLERTIERLEKVVQHRPLHSSRLVQQPVRLAKTAPFGGSTYPTEESMADTFGIIFQDGDFPEDSGTASLLLTPTAPSATRVAKSIPSKWFEEGSIVVVAEVDGQFYILSWIEAEGGGGTTNVCNQISAYPSFLTNVNQLFWHAANGSCSWVTICDAMKTLNGYINYVDPISGQPYSYARNQYFVIQTDGTCRLQAFDFCLEAKKSVAYDPDSDVHQYLALTPFESPNGGLACTWKTFNLCDEIKRLFGHDTTKNQIIWKKKDVDNVPGACELITFCDALKTINGYSPGQSRRQFVSIIDQACEVTVFDACTELKELFGHDEDVKQFLGHDANSSVCKWIDFTEYKLLKATVTAASGIAPGGSGNISVGGATKTGNWNWADGDWTLQNGCEVWVQLASGNNYDIITTNDCTKATRPA